MPTAPSYSVVRRIVLPTLLALGVLACLLPFLALCWYAHPSADDFLTANDVRKHGHLGYVGHMYLTWTGRYTSAVLWGVANPVAYGNTTEGYGLVCGLALLAVPAAFYGLLAALVPGQFRRRTLWLAAGVATALLLWQLPSPAEGFYWITATYNYIVPGLLTLLWLAALARHAAADTPAQRLRWLLVAVVLAVVVIGGNETNALPLALGVVGFTALRAVQRRRFEADYWWLSAAVVAACAVAFLAPGNFARMSQVGRLYTLWEALDRAVLSMWRTCLTNWLGNGALLALTVLLLPLSYRLSRVPGLSLNRLAQNPLFITLLIPVSLVVIFFLAWFTTSQTMPPRSRNAMYLFFLVGWLLNAHAWLRYLTRRSSRPALRLPGYVQGLLVGWMLLAFAVGHTRRLRGHELPDNANNVLVAYDDWLGGAAARYDAQLTARYHGLRDASWSGSGAAVVEPLHAPPRTILFGDITKDTQDWANLAYAEFFNKKSIRTTE